MRGRVSGTAPAPDSGQEGRASRVRGGGLRGAAGVRHNGGGDRTSR